MMVVGVGYRLLPMGDTREGPGGTYRIRQCRPDGNRRPEPLHGPGRAERVGSGKCRPDRDRVRLLRRPRRRDGAHRSKKPAGAPAVDFAVLHAAAAVISFVVACAIGLYLVFTPPSEMSLRLAIAYGVFGLVGFLAQMVVGMQAKLVPLLAWYLALADWDSRDRLFRHTPCPSVLSSRSPSSSGPSQSRQSRRIRAEHDSPPLGGRLDTAGRRHPVSRRQLDCRSPGTVEYPALVVGALQTPRVGVSIQHVAPSTQHLAPSSSIFNKIRCDGNPSGYLHARKTAALSVAARWHA